MVTTLADQWINVTADKSQDGILHTSCRKHQNRNKNNKILWKQTGLDGCCKVVLDRHRHQADCRSIGEPSIWTRFCSSTWTNTEVLYRCKVSQNFMLDCCCLSTFWCRFFHSTDDKQQILLARRKLLLLLLDAAKWMGCQNRVIDLLLQLGLALEAWSINPWNC